ncbi:Gfo/Idh/MocA family protein [Chloroflexota bacterium]
MLILVVGCGSIGKRHIRNLKALGAGDIIAHDSNMERCREVEQEYSVKVYDNLDASLAQKPDAAFICTSTSRHIPPALAAARNGCHLFIEKPLAHSLEGVHELRDVVAQNGLITLVGCNMRFHPSIVLMKKLLEEGRIGRVLSARVQAGQYLPDWHSWEDYRQGYSANKSLGGGVLLDGIHEIDYITWFLGKVKRIFCFAGKLSSLEIDTEDTAEIILWLKSGAVAEVHLNYTQHPYGRSCHLIGEEGTILWDFHEKQVKLYSIGTKEWQVFDEPLDYDINQMYVDEMKHFIRCLEGRDKPMQDLEAGKKALEIVLAAKESAKTEKVVNW